MARQAVEAFRRQTYQNKKLLVWNSGTQLHDEGLTGPDQWQVRSTNPAGDTIGQLRNSAIRYALEQIRYAEIIVTFDDDDISHPNRIAEQIQLLQSSGADVVGYSEALFWREPFLGAPGGPGQAWRYTSRNANKPLGTSLCYWRRTWERKPFQATSHGEDDKFLAGLKVLSLSSRDCDWSELSPEGHPRMVCRIHPGNTSSAYDPKKMARAKEWQRVPQWDEHCRGVFA